MCPPLSYACLFGLVDCCSLGKTSYSFSAEIMLPNRFSTARRDSDQPSLTTLLSFGSSQAPRRVLESVSSFRWPSQGAIVTLRTNMWLMMTTFANAVWHFVYRRSCHASAKIVPSHADYAGTASGPLARCNCPNVSIPSETRALRRFRNRLPSRLPPGARFVIPETMTRGGVLRSERTFAPPRGALIL